MTCSVHGVTLCIQMEMGGGGSNNGNRNANGGGDGGDDGGDDDDYSGEGDEDDGDDGNKFLRRVGIIEVSNTRKPVVV